VVAILIAVCACSSSPRAATSAKTASPQAGPDVDHIIVGIDSLERGIRILHQLTGVKPVFGTVHAGRGTHSAWLGLGPRVVLEIHAPNPDSAQTPRSEAMSFYGLPRPMYWAVHTSNADSLNAVLVARGLKGDSATPGSRTRDGTTFRWRSLIPWGPLNRAILPYFMERGAPHPSSMSPAGCTLAQLMVVTPKADSIRALLAMAAVRARVDSGPRDALHVELQCPTGLVKLPQNVGGGFALMRSLPPPTAAGIALGVTRDSVERLLGKPDTVLTPAANDAVLMYFRGSSDGLQVGIRDGRVESVVLKSPEAGLLDGVRVGLPFVRLMVRWGQPVIDSIAGTAIWRATGWEIVAHPELPSQTVGIIQLRRNGMRECPLVTDNLGRRRYVCNIAP
jgi:hypothetical protein